MIEFQYEGDFIETNKFLKRLLKINNEIDFNSYGQKGVKALASATPIDSGITADSWSYEIEKAKDSVTITWSNSNVVSGVPIAIILQYGHGTGTGGYVQGRDYINPAIQPVFDEISEAVRREVSK